MNHKIRNILLGALLTVGLGAPPLHAADVAISALPAGSALAGTEPIPMVQSAATKKTTPDAIATYLLSGSATTEVLANNAGAFDGDAGFTFNATNDTINLGGATLTASDPVLDLSQTWNNAAVTFNAVNIDITSTASAAASNVLRAVVGGTTVLRADKTGDLYVGGTTTSKVYGSNTATSLQLGNNVGLENQNAGRNVYLNPGSGGGGVSVVGSAPLGWAPATTSVGSAMTLQLHQDGASYVLGQRTGTNAQTFRVYDTYTDSSNYARIALKTGLTGDWVQVAAESAGTPGLNFGIALSPAGTGAISAQVPDSTAAGGNARGNNAVDWQMTRGAATQVASGAESVIGGGTFNTASGIRSTVAGGQTNNASSTTATVGGGTSNTASGASSTISGGSTNISSGQVSWIPGGAYATTRGLVGAGAYAADRRSATGDAQVILQPVRRTTTGDTPVSLATDGTPAATTVMVLPSDSTATCQAIVTANTTTAGVVSMAGFRAEAIVKNDSSTMTISGGTCTAIGTADAALTTATCALVANGTLDAIEMQVTGVAATTVYWVSEVKCVQAL